MRIVRILIEAERRIRDVGWTQGAHARDSNGFPIRFGDTGHPEPAAYSLYGSVADNDVVDMMHAREFISKALDKENLIVWNDDPARTVEEVKRVVNKAIELAFTQHETPRGHL